MRSKLLVVVGVLALVLGPVRVAAADAVEWTTVSPPHTTSLDRLTGVSCTSPTSCLAVGRTLDSTTYASQAVSMRFDGTAWSPVAVPTGPDGGSTRAIDCVTASDCWAVGVSTVDLATVPLVEHWNGTAWSVVSTSLPAQTELNGVACAATDDCWAVGKTAGPTYAHWDGTTWSIAAPAVGPNSQVGSLAAVTCAASDDCWAAGANVVPPAVGAGDGPPLVTHWDGTLWTEVTTPVPAGVTLLVGIDCAATDDCMAVGFTTPDFVDVQDVPVGLHWDGTSWALTPTVAPHRTSSDGYDHFESVSCPAVDRCWAVGEQSPASVQDEHPLLEVWDGTTWRLASAQPEEGELLDVSCTADDTCLAVGLDYRGTGIQHLAQRHTAAAVPAAAVAEAPSAGLLLVGALVVGAVVLRRRSPRSH